MAITFTHSGIHPSAGSIAAVEQVVEVQSEDGLLQHLLGLQTIAQREVRNRIARQRTVGILCIVEILTRYIVRVPDSLEAFIVEVYKAVENS